MQDYSKKCLATATSSFIIGMKNPKKGMVINMTSKERAELKSQAMTMDSIFQIGKASLTPQMTQAIRDALHARELIKISVLKNCADDPREIAEIIAERTHSVVVKVIGKKIILFRQAKKNSKYELPVK